MLTGDKESNLLLNQEQKTKEADLLNIPSSRLHIHIFNILYIIKFAIPFFNNYSWVETLYEMIVR